MLSIDPEQTRVILVGASEFPKDPEHLPSLPAVAENIKDLRHVLADPEVVGIPETNITSILDEPLASNIGVKLAEASSQALDTLIVYYAGH